MSGISGFAKNNLDLVRNTLTEIWAETGAPTRIKQVDLEAAIGLLTNIAFEAILRCEDTQQTQARVSFKACNSSVSEGPETSLSDRIKAHIWGRIKDFVEENAYEFNQACYARFPFSLLHDASAENGLKDYLSQCGSGIFYRILMTDSRWLEEEELNRRFGAIIKEIPEILLEETCADLISSYFDEDLMKAGYYLVWLLKVAGGCDFEIPKTDFFNKRTAVNVLSEFVIGMRGQSYPENFIRILCGFAYKQPLFYYGLLNAESISIFQEFVHTELRVRPMKEWPAKSLFLVNFFQTESLEKKCAVAENLTHSEDLETSVIGNHLLGALKSQSLYDKLPHFYALMELFPRLDARDIQSMFGSPFYSFTLRKRSTSKNEPSFVKEVLFNEMPKVFIHGSLMIGVYDTKVKINDRPAPRYLLAFDRNTEKMIWAFEIEHREYFLEKVGDRIALLFAGEKTLQMICPETGELDYTVELTEPAARLSWGGFDTFSFHINETGCTFQCVTKDSTPVLIGGKIENQQWHLVFECEDSPGTPQLLSSHFGFQMESHLSLYGPKGHKLTIENCYAAEACGDKLYTIQKDPNDQNKRRLVIRVLKEGSQVVSEIKKIISLEGEHLNFVKILDHKKVVLFRGGFDSTPIFIDLENDHVVYSGMDSEIEFSASYIITDTGKIWTWDTATSEIRKISYRGVKKMGRIERSRESTLIHVDKDWSVYFSHLR